MSSSEKQAATTSNAAKKLARLVAVQVLYQASYGEETLAEILRRSLDNVSVVLNDEEKAGETISGIPNAELLNNIVFGVDKHKQALEEMLSGALDSKHGFTRMEVLLRTLLMAGAYELHHHSEIDAPIIVSDYVDVARAYFNAKEPGLVNAVLDKLAKTLRS